MRELREHSYGSSNGNGDGLGGVYQLSRRASRLARDVESMMSDIGRWMGALSDLDQAEREAKNPPIFKKLFAGKTVEQEAMEVFAAKRKAQAQRDELKQWIGLTLGQSAWDELVRTEGKYPQTASGDVVRPA
jgi:hypothetical protein